jgi:hypothetical protein
LSGTTHCSHNAKPVRSAAMAPSTPSLAELPSHQAVTIARVHHRSDPATPRDTLAEPMSFIFFFSMFFIFSLTFRPDPKLRFFIFSANSASTIFSHDKT